VTDRRPEWWWARRAAQELGLDGRLRKVATGMDTTFMLATTSGTRWAVRVGDSPIRTHDAMLVEAAWIARLADNEHLRVPPVRATTGGDRVVELSDGDQRRCAMALGWIGGRKIREHFGSEHARRLGAALAALHVDSSAQHVDPTTVKDWRPRLCGIGPLDQLVEVAGPEARQVAEELETLVLATCGALAPEASGLVNRDIGPHNTVWDPADERPGLFDFNDTGWGPYVSDLARYVHALRWRPDGDVLVAAALDGYQEVAELPAGWSTHSEVFEAACNLFGARYYAPQVSRRGPRVLELVHQMLDAARRPLASL
jgi:Ser/Thr protein kinase RdoA (MazF antagonist)